LECWRTSPQPCLATGSTAPVEPNKLLPMKSTISFLDAVPHRPTEFQWRFRGLYCLHLLDQKVNQPNDQQEALPASCVLFNWLHLSTWTVSVKTSVNF
jgi:hypothetical protein